MKKILIPLAFYTALPFAFFACLMSLGTTDVFRACLDSIFASVAVLEGHQAIKRIRARKAAV